MKQRQFITINRRLDALDKIRAYYIDARKLSDLQEKRRLQYEEAHRLRLAGYSKEQTINILLKRATVMSKPDGYRVCHHAEILFGDIASSNKEGLRVILTENFFRLYQKAIIGKENLKEANRALENIAKINSLMSQEEAINWREILI